MNNNNLYIVMIFILFCRWKRKVCSRNIELLVWDKCHHKQRQSCASSLLYGWSLWPELNSRTQHACISTQGKEEETIRGRAKFNSCRKAPILLCSVCGGLRSVKQLLSGLTHVYSAFLCEERDTEMLLGWIIYN